MPHLAITYPSLAAGDLAWIQTIRQQHDPNFTLVAPHFTLVFHVFHQSATALSDHLRTALQGQQTIHFALRSALVVKDALSDNTHTFLVPDQGFGDLVKLHDKVYTGMLANELRLDIPYIPHITVATSPNATHCKRIADEINSEHVAIQGAITTIDLIEVANRTVTTVEQFLLG